MDVERITIDAVDSDGNWVELYGFQRFVSYTPLSGPASRNKGGLELFAPDGEPLNQDGEVFVGVLTGARFKRR